MITLNVPGIHCEKCIERITNDFTEEGFTFSTDLEAKTVSVEGDDAEVARAIEELDDLGFEATRA